jgi:hypothetical protein
MAFCTIVLVAAKEARSTFGTFVLKTRTRLMHVIFVVSTKKMAPKLLVIGCGEKAVS